MQSYFLVLLRFYPNIERAFKLSFWLFPNLNTIVNIVIHRIVKFHCQFLYRLAMKVYRIIYPNFSTSGSSPEEFLYNHQPPQGEISPNLNHSF